MKKAILILLGMILITGIAGAQLTFEPEADADIKISCFGATYSNCRATDACNITIFYPNMTTLVNNQRMTNNGTYYNYTIEEIVVRGEYYNVVNCWTDASVENLSGYTTFNFIVTKIPATSQGNVAVGIIIGIVALMFLFIYISFRFLDTDTLFPAGLFFLLISLILSIYVLYLGYTYTNEILLSSAATNVQSVVFISILYSMIGIAFLGMLALTIKTVKEIRERKSFMQTDDGWKQS